MDYKMNKLILTLFVALILSMSFISALDFDNKITIKYKAQLEEQKKQFLNTIQEKNNVISKLEKELIICKQINSDSKIVNANTNVIFNDDIKKTLTEKENKLCFLEKELASHKNTIDKLNMLIDILNKSKSTN